MARLKKSTPLTALDRLARRCGMELGFRDAFGRNVAASIHTRRQLLAAMGVAAGTERKAVAALAKLSRETAEEALPPVLVATARGSRCSIELPLPKQPRRLSWCIALEGGGELSGVAEPRRRPGGKSNPENRANQCRVRITGVPWGYHRLHIAELEATASLIVTPPACWLPEEFTTDSGSWGLAVQLYLVRSQRNWGFGDFGDLAELARLSGRRRADLLGINPLHQMFLDRPEQASPYSPASRLFLNPLYIDVTALPEFARAEQARRLLAAGSFRAALEQCRAAALVDYPGVARLKTVALRTLFDEFTATADRERKAGFARFCEERGEQLQRTCVFQALRQHFSGENDVADWRSWPPEFRDASSQVVTRFAESHRREIDFLAWLQWVADEQLGAAARTAREAGMKIGLYRDLAVGCDRSGAETWTDPGDFLQGVSVGAPPDVFNPAGQNWGLPAPHPVALRRTAYRRFIEVIRANMRHAGALRIDHVMALEHLYCVPDGAKPSDGAYLRYPIDDLVGILALESHRHRCLVIGEDLGTVPAGFRAKMAAANVLSYRVLFFEQRGKSGVFLRPAKYPRCALAVAGSHDLPTLRGWWEGHDIELKAKLGIYPDAAEHSSQRARRDRDRENMLRALRREGVLKADEAVDAEQFARAAHEYLARSRSALVAIQLDDLLFEADQVNVPATSVEYPNWRRKYGRTLEELAASGHPWRLLGQLPELRRSPRRAVEQKIPERIRRMRSARRSS